MIYTIKNFACLIFALCAVTCATSQTVRTGVMIVGVTPSGLAAAIQSAHSGVKTLLVDKGNFEEVKMQPHEACLGSGIYAHFIRRVELAQKFPYSANQSLSPAFAGSIFKAWADTVKNLTIITKTKVNGIRQDGRGWAANLSGKQIVKADVVVDASDDQYLAALASAKRQKATLDSVPYQSKMYRTGVSLIPAGFASPATLPLAALTAEADNFLFSSAPGIEAGTYSGQAAGAAAAYCAFFKTSSKNLSVRTIQSELLSFGSHLLTFDDISLKDSSFNSIQSIALTGILKGRKAGGKLLFLPDSTVSVNEIATPVKEYFTRSQIWFLDNKAETLTVERTLSLIKFVASRGEELNKEVEKGWNKTLKLPGKFDLRKPVTRREFAALFNYYVKPFNVAVDLKGSLKR